MIIIKKADALSQLLFEKKKNRKQTGFVPTMGALHHGHLAIIKKSVERNDITVCSIFVNPTQFNDDADFIKYPVTIEKDILLLEAAGCNILFLPPVSEIYPQGIQNQPDYNIGFLETVLEGKFRPGHFQGVCQVVHRLLQIILPHTLYIGQKDYQQCMVIKKLLSLTQLDKDINTEIVPTMRELDGLAMSSRNTRLSTDARQMAPLIAKTLQQIKENIVPGKIDTLIQTAILNLNNAGFKTDYIELANAETLERIDNWDVNQKAIALAAAFIDEVRLIDNIKIN